jgi:hypothetical protein
MRPPAICAAWGEGFKGKRADGRYCSDRCRQNAHRKPVTDKKYTQVELYLVVTSRRAPFLPYSTVIAPYTRTIHCLQTELAINIRPCRWLPQSSKPKARSKRFHIGPAGITPGSKVLVKPGHTVEDRQVALLKDNERLRLDAMT